MKKTLILIPLLLASACSSAPKKPIEILGEQKPTPIVSDAGELVNIHPVTGRWTWIRKPKEVVSEMVRMISARNQQIQELGQERTRLTLELEAVRFDLAKARAAAPVAESTGTAKAAAQ